MKICIDARMMKHGGIGTYIKSLIPHLPVEVVPLQSPIYTLREQLEFFRKIPPCGLFWSPHFNVPLFPIRAKKQIVTIHDVFHLDYRKYKAKILLKKAASSKIITVSEFSKRRILHYFPNADITVIHPGADHLLGIEPKPLEVKKPFFLCVGNEKPHKNIDFVRKIVPNLYVAKGDLPVENLVWLYQNAEALIFPSLYEGWGLPPLEAMSLGCPVLASNAASIPEACQDAALYFDPKEPQSLKDTLALLPAKREQLTERGWVRAKMLTWAQASKKHLNLFHSSNTDLLPPGFFLQTPPQNFQ